MIFCKGQVNSIIDISRVKQTTFKNYFVKINTKYEKSYDESSVLILCQYYATLIKKHAR